MKISHYLIKRLEEIGVKHVFGIPGDYILSFFEDLAKSPLELIGTCNELNAGYAADAYARLNGISCAAVTYGVGAFSILNAVAGAYAERVPLILISGAPSTKREGHLLHHTAKDRTLQFEIFKRVTEKAVILNDITAPKLIDEAITTCYLTKRPVYIELPIDIVSLSCQEPSPLVLQEKKSDEKALSQAIQKTKELLASAKDPCCLLGIEVQRFHLEKLAETFLKNSGLSFATTLLGKSVLPESHPQFIGVYSGALVTKDIIDRVENSDLCLGTLMTDINLGLYSSKLDPSKMILAAEESVRIGRHIYKNVLLKDFLYGLSQNPRMFTSTPFVHPAKSLPPFKAQKVKLTHKRFYHCIQKFLKNDHMLLVDTGDAMLSACDLLLPDHIPYIAEAFYLSIGYALPATLGAEKARPDLRPLLFIGDGAFQMTAQELSTLLRNHSHAIIFLLNNEGYTLERVLHEGPFNDIQSWKYHDLPKVFNGDSKSFDIWSEEDLETALFEADQNKGLSFLEVHLAKMDCSENLKRIGKIIRGET